MNKYIRSIALLIFFANSSPCFSAVLKTVPLDKWVKETNLNFDYQVPEEQLTNGIYYLLVDSQSLVPKNAPPTRYYRNTRQIINSTGVEKSSQIDVSYDPNYQELNFHSLVIWRDKKAIDKSKTATTNILQQEKELENLIYDGQETLNIILDDVRVGDILDYSYSIEGSNPVFEGIFSQTNSLQWSVPVNQQNIRILWLKDKELKIRQHNSQHQLIKLKTKTGIEYSLTQNKIEPLLSDEKTPNWYNKYPFIEFSDSADWQEVVQWSLPLFENAITNDDSIKNLAKTFQQQSESKQQQLMLALQYVQHEIRYLGIEMGVNSHKPSLAQETLQRRYGDCKDKVVLLNALLNQLQIESYPALVNTSLTKELENRLAKPTAFDHVITKAIINNKIYWLDPTRQYQNNSLETIFQPDYDVALIVSPTTSDLEKININKSNSYLTIHDDFEIPSDINQKVTFHSSSELGGYKGESNRRELAQYGLTSQRANYLKFYQDYYSEIMPIEEVTFSELANGNRESNESYAIDNFWEKDDDDKKYYAWFYANEISHYLKNDGIKNRKDPLAIAYPVNLKQTIKVKFEKSGWDFSAESIKESNEFFDYSREVKYDNDTSTLTLSYSYNSKTDHVPLDKINLYDEALQKLDNDTTYGIYRSFTSVESTRDPNTQNQLTSNSNLSTPENSDNYRAILIIFSLILLLIILCIYLWRSDLKRNPFVGEMIFYPVSIAKFLILNILTFGIFGSYWIYKNFKYIRDNSNAHMMPLARGIFDYLWFYSLYNYLVKDSIQRFEKNILPNALIVGFLALCYFIFHFSISYADLTSLIILLSGLTLVPLLKYVNQVNQNNPQALKYNSRWSVRHLLVFLVSAPLILLSSGSSFGILPADSVISGDKILAYDINYLQRKKVIVPTEKIQYFYSDAFLLVRNDGNGFTNENVFSYWLDEEDKFQFDRAGYSEIKDIEVTWSKSSLENTIITIVRENDTEFLLFVSADEKKDQIFVNKLKENWKRKTAE